MIFKSYDISTQSSGSNTYLSILRIDFVWIFNR
nr:MAG TPA: hypothetical protein [Crassvirales sp.]